MIATSLVTLLEVLPPQACYTQAHS